MRGLGAAASSLGSRAMALGGGDVVVDSSAGGLSALYQGIVSAATSPITGGSAATFDGSTGYVSGAPFIGAVTTLAVEAWVKTTATNQMLIVNQAQVGNAGGWQLQQNNGKLTFYIQIGGSYTSVASGFAISDGAWHHCVGAWDATNLYAYVDGGLVATTLGVFGTLNNPGSQLFRIAQWVGGGLFWNGSIAEVAVYSSALSAARVAAHFWAGHYRDAATYAAAVRADVPRAWYRFAAFSSAIGSGDISSRYGQFDAGVFDSALFG